MPRAKSSKCSVIDRYDTTSRVIGPEVPQGLPKRKCTELEFRGYKLYVGEIRYWFQFDVAKEIGKKIVFAGFWTGFGGLALRYIVILVRPLNRGNGMEGTGKAV